MYVRDSLFIDGAWVSSTESNRTDVVDPSTGQVIGSVPLGTPEDIDRAVSAASAAFPVWSSTPREERTRLLDAVASQLDQQRDSLAELITRELGMPLRLANRIQIGLPVATFASMAQAVEEVQWEQELGSSLLLREPIGVVGAITPWNFPLHQIAAKLAPALAAGCTVVLKPSEVTPLNAFALFDIFEKVGLPPGVVNLVSGEGVVAGESLVSHPQVDMVSFTGSTAAGRRVGELAAATVKRVALELGGKSPTIILEDADLPAAVANVVGNCFLNSGQACNALTRMLVPRALLATAEALATAASERFVPSDPMSSTTRMGPLVSAQQLKRVREYISGAIVEGARIVTGGHEMPPGLDQGFFISPTIFSDVEPSMTIAREEIFGPVLVIMAYDTVEDAIAIANNSPYGLAGAVWSTDVERAIEVARHIRAGQIQINDGAHNPMAPFGGYKQSGNGREFGAIGVEEFLEIKSLQLPPREAAAATKGP